MCTTVDHKHEGRYAFKSSNIGTNKIANGSGEGAGTRTAAKNETRHGGSKKNAVSVMNVPRHAEDARGTWNLLPALCDGWHGKGYRPTR